MKDGLSPQLLLLYGGIFLEGAQMASNVIMGGLEQTS